MNTIQRIVKNIGVLSISQMVSYVLGFFILMYSARYLGVDGFGVLSFSLAFVGIFIVLMDLGLNTLTIREIARDKSLTNDYISNITLIKLVLATVTLSLIFLISNFFNYNQQIISVLTLIAIYTVFVTFSQMFYAVFQANEKMEYPSLGAILSNFLLLIGIIIAINYKFDITTFASIYTIVGIITFAYAILIFNQKFSLPKMKFDRIKWVSLIKEAWPFAITGISLNLYLWMSTIILFSLQGEGASGLYNASYRLIQVLLFIPVVFNTAIFPLMSKYYVSSEESLKFTFEKFFKILIIIAVPLGVGTVVLSNKIINLIYGNQFEGAIIVLQIIIWSTVLIFARSPFERLLESTNKQLIVTKIFIIAVIFNIILNLIIIPMYSYIGASLVTVLTDSLVIVILVYVTRNSISLSNKTIAAIVKIGIASFIMGIIINYLSNLNLFLLVFLGMVIYVVLILIFRILDEEEIFMIKSIFNR